MVFVSDTQSIVGVQTIESGSLPPRDTSVGLRDSYTRSEQLTREVKGIPS